MDFKKYLLSENKNYLAEKISDILTALQELDQHAGSMGSRHLTNNSEKIVSQIRRILHTKWGRSEQDSLKRLQKCGVAIMKSIEEKEDIIPVIRSCVHELESMLSDIGAPINKLPENVNKTSVKSFMFNENSSEEGPTEDVVELPAITLSKFSCN